MVYIDPKTGTYPANPREYPDAQPVAATSPPMTRWNQRAVEQAPVKTGEGWAQAWAVVDVEYTEAEAAALLASALQVAVTQIDAEADAARLRVAGDPLRAIEYQRAESDAKAYAAAGFAGDVPPAVASWAEAKEWTPRQAAEDILREAADYQAVLLAIRDVRLKGKEVARRATNPDEVRAAAADTLARIMAVTQAAPTQAAGIPQ